MAVLGTNEGIQKVNFGLALTLLENYFDGQN
jgi:hypothetical protein